ncbi:peptidoglycan DD-metalloendopeptidase family protein [Micromonospora echinofusca]|uniref:Peptidoglycan DD-metalloendopeptidase family protein n=1 Tax=Micromonospora echinofusca TaxID=47858 RepID=A0ABS3VUE4_MICEH|nr:peptidoglycan DD-metalloendopeptidase family protein [Micromonospora echinofusca]MBO4208165.1 peptidoglycan DD-metalloendopeptidase family protein [Micromonospora echinofusca]
MPYSRRLAGLAVPLLLIGSLVAAAPAASAAPGRPAPATPDVTDAVGAKLLGQAATQGRSATPADVRVTLDRARGRWAFGTAVLVAPHTEDAHPTGAVFVARADAGSWRIAFDGEAGFAALAAESPLATEEERRVFTTTPTTLYAGGDFRTGMALPFTVGQTWYLSGGPHGWGGYEQPYSSIDLAGGDQVVRAARAGTAYTMCKGWIRVIHDRGYATDYYHLWDNISVNGAAVSQGSYLGYTGTDVTCGGAASGRHVHFGLRQNNAYVPIADHDIGKWVFVGGGAYGGGARHGSAYVAAGGAVYNYGALGFTQGVVDTNGGGTLTRRSGPGTGYGAVGSLADGATVSISCSANGTSHTGRYGTTSLWNRLTDGSWVSDAYLWTGVNGAINGWC